MGEGDPRIYGIHEQADLLRQHLEDPHLRDRPPGLQRDLDGVIRRAYEEGEISLAFGLWMLMAYRCACVPEEAATALMGHYASSPAIIAQGRRVLGEDRKN